MEINQSEDEFGEREAMLLWSEDKKNRIFLGGKVFNLRENPRIQLYWVSEIIHSH